MINQTKGIFTLDDLYNNVIDNQWISNSDVYVEYGQTDYVNLATNIPVSKSAYFSGWSWNAAPAGAADKYDLVTDTVLGNRTGLINRIFAHATTANKNYSWIGGGSNTGTTSTRIDFSSDTTTTPIRGNFPISRLFISGAAAGNLDYGWFAGGGPSYPPGLLTSSVDRIQYSNDTVTASPRGNLNFSTGGSGPSTGSNSSGALGNLSYGWFNKGTLVDRIDYSNDTVTASPRGNLVNNRGGNAAASGNSSFGYLGGTSSVIDRIDYNDDTVTALTRGNLSNSYTGKASSGNSDYAWFNGGLVASSVAYSTVERIDYSNDTMNAVITGNIGRATHCGSSNADFGLPTPTWPFTYNLPTSLYVISDLGWFGGGGGGTGGSNAVTRYAFPNDTLSVSLRSEFSTSFVQKPGASGNLSYAWFGGGYGFPGPFPGARSTVNRLDYSNDTTTPSVRGPLTVSGRTDAIGNLSYGWFVGMNGTSIINRVEYANDTSTASPRGNSIKNGSGGSSGNLNYGWLSTGNPSTVDRIDYSNDTVTTSPRGPLSVARGSIAATGNANYGWFGGGYAPGGRSFVDRIDYSNDTVTASPRGKLYSSRGQMAATGNANYGWFGGGYGAYPPPLNNLMDRIDYNNDTVTASLRLSSGSSSRNATGISAVENGFS